MTDWAREDPDVRLMLRFQEGEEEAFDEIFRRYRGRMVNYLLKMTGHSGKAEELAQEVFLRVVDARASYAPRARLSTWLYRIGTNIALNELRRPEYRSAHAAGDEGTMPDGAPGAEAAARGGEIRAALSDALMSLPETQRAAILLCVRHDQGYREVGIALGISEKAVKSLIHRARETLRRKLEAHL